MPQKSKISVEEKIKLVQDYLLGELAPSIFTRKYNMQEQRLYEWVSLYKRRGIAGLIPATTTRKYSPETKSLAVQDYLSGTMSLNNICDKYDISRHSMLQKWILCYNSHGEFKQPNTGGAVYMTKGRKTTLNERIEIVGHCISSNKDYGKTIEKYDVSYQQIYGWVKKYEASGVSGLIDKRGKRKDESTMNEVEKLRAQIKLKEAENLRLQMENDLLKKLEALERGRNID